ncbi:MAG: type IV pilus biogenesis/stability protein PilW [Chromatiales bacterium]|nr:type IV pilus biogenesis/stability protein PilW [Chromatiales bacterium]
MKSRFSLIKRITLLLLATSTLMACTTGGVRTDGLQDDSTGNLGQVQGVPGAGDIYVKLAVAYLKEKQLDVALVKAKQAVQIEPTNTQAHNVIALLYERLGEYPLAERHFNRALELQPKNSYVLNAFGSFLCNRKRYDEADGLFQRALSNPLYKTPEIALTNAGVCMVRVPDLNRAERYFRTALESNPRFPPALFQMAQVSYRKEQYLSVRAYLQRYHERLPMNAASLWLGIRAERKLGDKEAEARYASLLRTKFPDSKESMSLAESQ